MTEKYNCEYVQADCSINIIVACPYLSIAVPTREACPYLSIAVPTREACPYLNVSVFTREACPYLNVAVSCKRCQAECKPGRVWHRSDSTTRVHVNCRRPFDLLQDVEGPSLHVDHGGGSTLGRIWLVWPNRQGVFAQPMPKVEYNQIEHMLRKPPKVFSVSPLG